MGALPCRAQFSTSNGSTRSTRSIISNAGNNSAGSTTSGGYPIGTGTKSNPNNNTGTPLTPGWGIGGGPIYGGYANSTLGQFGYYNSPGLGYYASTPYSSDYPTYPAPVALGDNYYRFGGLSARLGYWRAPSGFYYPWCPPVYLPGLAFPTNPPIYMMDQGSITEAQPPISMFISDMRTYIDTVRLKHQLDQSAYEHLSNSLNLMAARSAQIANSGGNLDPSNEDATRRELQLLSTEISRSLNP